MAGCGSSSGQPAPGAIGSQFGVPLRLASCSDWRKSSYRERIDTVNLLEKFAGGPSGSPAGHGVTLPDDKAYKYLDIHCRQAFDSNVKLYKLYVRGAAFQKLGG
jgi:hypothetical protein